MRVDFDDMQEKARFQVWSNAVQRSHGMAPLNEAIAWADHYVGTRAGEREAAFLTLGYAVEAHLGPLRSWLHQHLTATLIRHPRLLRWLQRCQR